MLFYKDFSFLKISLFKKIRKMRVLLFYIEKRKLKKKMKKSKSYLQGKS